MSKEIFMNTKKLSEFTEVVINEAEKIFELEKYVPNSVVWHAPQIDGTCEICLAGACFVGFFDSKPRQSITLDSFPVEVKNRLKAADYLRLGLWDYVVRDLGIPHPEDDIFKHIEGPNRDGGFYGLENAQKFIADFKNRIIPEMKKAEENSK